MKRFSTAPLLGASIIAAASLLAACGGGGGSGSTIPGGTNPTPVGSSSPGATPTPIGSTPTPAPTPTPGAQGQVTLSGNALANAIVVFTCGCSGEAGEIRSDASGNFTISASATAVPASSAPYTPPGHNLMVVGYEPAAHGQTWTMEFFGNTPTHDLNLSGTSGTNVSDQYTTAASLYVYYETIQYYSGSSTTDKTYDVFNFNDIVRFAQSLRTSVTGNNSAETKFLADIASAQSSHASLYPAVPQWDPGTGDGISSTILADIKSVATSGDAALPKPCVANSTCTSPTPAP